MKTWTRKLLSDYPLLWNTRSYLLLPLLALMHVLAFLVGYFRSYSITSIQYGTVEPSAGVFMFLFLAGTLILIVWLMYYLRNNALKSYYPVSVPKLFAEFLIILTVSAGLVTVVDTYRTGAYLKFNRTFRDVNIVDEANTLNLAHSFLPLEFDGFYKGRNCDESVKSIDTVVITEPNTYYGDTIPAGKAADFSYLNYCNQAVSLYPDSALLHSGPQLHAIAVRWLREGRKDSVARIIRQSLEITNRYGSRNNLDPAKWTEEIFSTPDFRVTRKLASNIYYEDSKQGSYDPAREDAVMLYTAEQAIYFIHNARKHQWFGEDELYFLLFGFCVAIAVLSFRLTGLRVWIVALIGGFIWAILLGILLVITEKSQSMFLLLWLILYCAISAYAIWNIRMRRSKTPAGVAYIWMLWALPALLPAIAQWIASLLRNDYYYDRYNQLQRHWLDDWISNHTGWIIGLDMLLMIVVIGILMLPLARRWQAMPEE